MKLKRYSYIKIILLIPFLLSSCFPTYKATRVLTDTLAIGKYVDVQAKLFDLDNTTYLFPNGFYVDEKCISGNAIKKIFTSDHPKSIKTKIPFDSITAMITYEETTSGARYFGSFLFGLTGPPLTFLGIYCIACPKCCFGSCPTVYTYDGENYNLEAELFSECISRQLENNDIDLLRQDVKDNILNLKITNEALETHYINKFDLLIAEHPKGTEVYPTIDDSIILISDPISSQMIKNKDEDDITKLLIYDDGEYYRSGVEKVAELRKGPTFDFVDIKIPYTKNSSIKMIIKYRNTLLSTTLLYDVVIGSQGAAGLEWTNRMNNDADYAEQFKMIYEAFSGIKLKVLNNGKWINLGCFKDAGPLNWKYLAADVTLNQFSGQSIRLEFVPDNFMIDYIAFDTTQSQLVELETKLIYPSEILDGNGDLVSEALGFIEKDDKDYLRTEPGDSYNLTYFIPSKEKTTQTAFILSKGFYNEWIRGSWIEEGNKNYSFNLYDVQGNLSHLVDSWLETRTLLESEFFNSRIILKEAK
jgi:hypothetical protein